MLTPPEFHNKEVLNGPPVKVSMTFRLSIPTDAAVQHMAWEYKCDKSTIVRQALHEYFAARGKDAWGVT
jgi:predicted transcriptional regulator